jgi:hypothetical protein
MPSQSMLVAVLLPLFMIFDGYEFCLGDRMQVCMEETMLK